MDDTGRDGTDDPGGGVGSGVPGGHPASTPGSTHAAFDAVPRPVTHAAPRRPATGDRVVLRRYGRLLPPLLIATGAAVDISTPPAYTPAALFAAAPVVAAPLLSARATAACGALALLVLLVLLFTTGTASTGDAAMHTTTMATVALLALGINRLLRRSEQQLASARGIAEAAQLAVLPVPPARIGGLDVAARYKAAQSDARIGGDLYAVQETPYGTRLIVGDVRGKGLGSVEAVAVVIGAFRESAEVEPTLEGVAERLERALQREGARRHGLDEVEGFTTAALAEVPAGTPGRLRIVNRGHPAPLLLLEDGKARYLEPVVPALPLGMTELGRWPDRADEARLPPGALLLFYTDGLSESRNRAGEFYDPALHLSGRRFAHPEALLEALVADVGMYTGGQTSDDMALLAVGRCPGATGGSRGAAESSSGRLTPGG
ncbi:serine/threonine-protein phosphatase [Streptomyces sp. N2-109]|uniref:Serine/threonine-protein phosphatase n=1 Tax=Streptomyces gossypii TaxID=2883101 RepID=A0ABT2JP61_9ACTN|nr:serine/threonine-protein phosphatase [Streptomyces gossypii]